MSVQDERQSATSSNVLSKEVQARLRKKSYDFARADAFIKSIGAKNTGKGQGSSLFYSSH